MRKRYVKKSYDYMFNMTYYLFRGTQTVIPLILVAQKYKELQRRKLK